MSIEEQNYIDDHCCPLNADFTINKNYEKERAYYMKKYEEAHKYDNSRNRRENSTR